MAPEFAQNKALAKKLLEALQRKSKPVKAEKGAPGASPGRCNACGYNKMQKGAFCGSCGRCVHGYTTEQCRSGCRPIIQYTPYFHTQWMLQTGMTDCSNTSCGRGVHDHRRQSGCIVGGAETRPMSSHCSAFQCNGLLLHARAQVHVLYGCSKSRVEYSCNTGPAKITSSSQISVMSQKTTWSAKAEDTTPAIKAKNVTFYNNIKVPKGSLQKASVFWGEVSGALFS